MRIAILVAVLGERDAVATDAREMGAALRRGGHDVRLFANASHGAGMAAEPLGAIADVLDDPRALVIYHFAFGWPRGIDLLRAARCRRIVRYHNVTPPEFFAGWSEEYEASCRAGRDEIASLAELDCDLYLGDSSFNVDDLLAAGVPRERTAVLAPFNRIDRLVETPADLAFVQSIETRATTWLAVGRLAPNKGHLALFDAFATYLDRCDADARLLVVGSEDSRLAEYNAALHERLAALRIERHVHFLRDVSEPRLKAAYLSADVLVSLSAHEGFCVPLVEAMALGVPVIARDAGAQAATLGGAGLAWSDPQAALVAASVERLRRDPALRALLRERGIGRVERAFTTGVLARGLADALEPFA